jgi:hypothetical protein
MQRKILALLSVLAGFALPATVAHAASPGVNIAGAPTADRVQEALATGAKQVRIFALWKDFEPNGPGEFPSSEVNLANTVKVYDAAIRELNASGAKPVFVMTEVPSWANGSSDPLVPPTVPGQFADFLQRFAAHNKAVGSVGGYEVWNEPDESTYWHPAPDAAAYATMLKSAYAGIKKGDPSATVVTGPTTGNNYEWIQSLYDFGAGGSFDAVAVHTDTACSVVGPDTFYRDSPGGPIGRYTFLGYRSVRDVMLAHGDDKPIWMTELGWSSTAGSDTSCTRGLYAGKKPSGVTQAAQAAFLTKAYACLANDPYVTQADVFTMRDDSGQPIDELRHYGLLTPSGTKKTAWSAFAAVAAANGGSAAECGDFTPPTINVVSPVPGQQFVGKLDVKASAADSGVGIARISFAYDTGTKIRNFTTDLLAGKTVGLGPWQGSGKLGLGKHTILVTALDKNGNTATTNVDVEKVATLASTLMPAFKLGSKKVRCSGTSCRFGGKLLRGAGGGPSINGKVAVEWQFRNKKGKWRKIVGGLKAADKPFTFKSKLKYKGLWRVRFVYQGQAPWKSASSSFVTFRTR